MYGIELRNENSTIIIDENHEVIGLSSEIRQRTIPSNLYSLFGYLPLTKQGKSIAGINVTQADSFLSVRAIDSFIDNRISGGRRILTHHEALSVRPSTVIHPGQNNHIRRSIQERILVPFSEAVYTSTSHGIQIYNSNGKLIFDSDFMIPGEGSIHKLRIGERCTINNGNFFFPFNVLSSFTYWDVFIPVLRRISGNTWEAGIINHMTNPPSLITTESAFISYYNSMGHSQYRILESDDISVLSCFIIDA